MRLIAIKNCNRCPALIYLYNIYLFIHHPTGPRGAPASAARGAREPGVQDGGREARDASAAPRPDGEAAGGGAAGDGAAPGPDGPGAAGPPGAAGGAEEVLRGRSHPRGLPPEDGRAGRSVVLHRDWLRTFKKGIKMTIHSFNKRLRCIQIIFLFKKYPDFPRSCCKKINEKS